jgi:hypothetical protein
MLAMTVSGLRVTLGCPLSFEHLRMGRFVLILGVVLGLCGPRTLGAPPSRQQTDGKQSIADSGSLTNKDVLSMVKAGLSPAVVIAKIKSSACDFDTSPTELTDLKKAGVPDSVILAMVQALTARSIKQREVSAEPSVDQILAKYVQALGGRTAIERQTQSVSRGSWESEVKSGTVEVYGKAPNRSLTVMDVPGGAIAKRTSVRPGRRWPSQHRRVITTTFGQPTLQRAARNAQRPSSVLVRCAHELQVVTLPPVQADPWPTMRPRPVRGGCVSPTVWN